MGLAPMGIYHIHICLHTLPETNSSPLKSRAWKTFSFPFGKAGGEQLLISGRVCTHMDLLGKVESVHRHLKEIYLLLQRVEIGIFHLIQRAMWVFLTPIGECIWTSLMWWNISLFVNFYWYWLVVSSQLKNISQTGSFAEIGVKIKTIWNRHLVIAKENANPLFCDTVGHPSNNQLTNIQTCNSTQQLRIPLSSVRFLW